MASTPRKYLDVIGSFLPFNNVAGSNVRRFIERPTKHKSAHVYTKKDEASQKKKQSQIFDSTSTKTKEKK